MWFFPRKISGSRDFAERNTTGNRSEKLAFDGLWCLGRTKFLWLDANSVWRDEIKTHWESCLWLVEITFLFGDVIGDSRFSTTASTWVMAR